MISISRSGSIARCGIASGKPATMAKGESIEGIEWDAESRSKLWRNAMAANAQIELQPCRNITGHVLRYGAQ